MDPIRVLPPVVEPVSLATAKAHLRVTHSAEDEYIAGILIPAAREYVEARSWLSLVPQTWELRLDEWPRTDRSARLVCDYIDLPNPPILAVESVAYVDADGEPAVMPAEDYSVDTSEPWRIVTAAGATWPAAETRSIRIRFRAGFVPRLLQYATAEAMEDDLDHDAGSFARVTSGPDAGLYEKVGASGDGAWEASPYAAVHVIPIRLVQAILLLVEYWYSNRGAVLTGSISKALEYSVDAMIRSCQRAKVA